MKMCQLKKKWPLVVCACVTWKYGSWSKFKICQTLLFASSNAFQDSMTPLGSTHNQRAPGKRTLWRPSPNCWGLGTCTNHPIATKYQPKNREIFVKMGISVQKLFMNFQNAEIQTHKQITPPHFMGMGETFYALFSNFLLTLFHSG